VLGLPPSVRIYFATGLVDMRNGIDGLRTIVEQILKRNPNDGHLFVFVGKRRDMLKILFCGSSPSETAMTTSRRAKTHRRRSRSEPQASPRSRAPTARKSSRRASPLVCPLCRAQSWTQRPLERS